MFINATATLAGLIVIQQVSLLHYPNCLIRHATNLFHQVE